jgi:hypothetical protein
MYLIPFLVILVIALAIFFSPILAVILMFVFLLGLGAFKFLGRGVDPEHAPPPKQSTPPAEAPGAATSSSEDPDEETGPWGETWPEKESEKAS